MQIIDVINRHADQSFESVRELVDKLPFRREGFQQSFGQQIILAFFTVILADSNCSHSDRLNGIFSPLNNSRHGCYSDDEFQSFIFLTYPFVFPHKKYILIQ
jgi:hypothetical protein